MLTATNYKYRDLTTSKIACFISVDPLQFKYAYYTPYQYAGNKPISYIDLDGAEEAAVSKEQRLRETTAIIRLNSPLLSKLIRDSNADAFSIVYSLYKNKMGFRDDYAERKLNLDDSSVVDIVQNPKFATKTIIQGTVWNDFEDHSKGFKVITLQEYNTDFSKMPQHYRGNADFWEIEPTYTRQDWQKSLHDKSKTMFIDWSQGVTWEIVVKLLSKKATNISSTITWVYEVNGIDIKRESKARLRTLGKGNSITWDIYDATDSSNTGLWYLEYGGLDKNGDEIWNENSFLYKERFKESFDGTDII